MHYWLYKNVNKHTITSVHIVILMKDWNCMQTSYSTAVLILFVTWPLLLATIATAAFSGGVAGCRGRRRPGYRRILAGRVAVIAVVGAKVVVSVLHFGETRRRRRRHRRALFAARYELHASDGVRHVGEIFRVQLARMLVQLLLLIQHTH